MTNLVKDSGVPAAYLKESAKAAAKVAWTYTDALFAEKESRKDL